jgi:hypothetical protein
MSVGEVAVAESDEADGALIISWCLLVIDGGLFGWMGRRRSGPAA